MKVKGQLPRAIGMIAKAHFEMNFKKQGFDGIKWAEVERRESGTKAYKSATKAQKTSSILSGKTKLLAKSIYIKKATWPRIVMASSSPYGIYHNNGISGRLKQRKFMGNSDKLNKKVISFVKKQLDWVFKR